MESDISLAPPEAGGNYSKLLIATPNLIPSPVAQWSQRLLFCPSTLSYFNAQDSGQPEGEGGDYYRNHSCSRHAVTWLKDHKTLSRPLTSHLRCQRTGHQSSLTSLQFCPAALPPWRGDVPLTIQCFWREHSKAKWRGSFIKDGPAPRRCSRGTS